MIAQWMAYGLATSALIACAAWSLERLLQRSGVATRWVWAFAIVGSLLLPLTVRVTGHGVASLVRSFDARAGESPRLIAGANEPAIDTLPSEWLAMLEGADAALGTLWVGLTIVAFGLYVGTWARLRHERRRCERRELEGEAVLVSRGWGPAAVGVRSPIIVVPDWVLREAADVRRLVLLHEREHVQAGDQVLLAFAPLTLLAMPWNVALWWQLHRLRLAIEVDCDRRVLARGVAPDRYGSLLIEVAGRAKAGLFAAALVPPRSVLEARIIAMTERWTSPSRSRRLVFAAACFVCVALACGAPAPFSPATVVDVRAHEIAKRLQAAIEEGEAEGATFELNGRVVTSAEISRLDAGTIRVLGIVHQVKRVGGEAGSSVVRINTGDGGDLPDPPLDWRRADEALPENVRYVIDDRSATREEALRIPASSIMSVEVTRREMRAVDDAAAESGTVRITTKRGA